MSGPMRNAGWVVAVSVCVILAFSDAGAPRKETSQESIKQDDHDMEVYNEWKAENAGAPDGPLSDSITQNQGDDYSAWLASEGPNERRATDAYIRSFRRSGSGSGSGSGSSTKAPTKAPTAPSKAPTKAPTGTPSNAPTKSPTKAPTAPTKAPTNAPTFAPSFAPSSAPSNVPSFAPSFAPSNAPSFGPTVEPVQAVQEVDMVMPYASANDFVKDVKRVTVVKKGYGKSIGVMKDACTTCLPPPAARPTTCPTTCVLKAGRRSGLYEPYWVLKDGVGIDMKVKQSNRRASVSLAITFTTTIVGATNVDTAAVMAGVTDPAALVANINAVVEAEKAADPEAYAAVTVMPASAVAAIKPPAPPPSAESFMAAQAGSAEDEDGAPVAVIVIGALIVSGCMMGWPIYCLIYKKDNDKEKDIQETVLISNAPGSKTDPGAGGFEI